MDTVLQPQHQGGPSHCPCEGEWKSRSTTKTHDHFDHFDYGFSKRATLSSPDSRSAGIVAPVFFGTAPCCGQYPISHSHCSLYSMWTRQGACARQRSAPPVALLNPRPRTQAAFPPAICVCDAGQYQPCSPSHGLHHVEVCANLFNKRSRTSG